MRTYDLPPRRPLNNAGFLVIFGTALIGVLVNYEFGVLSWATALWVAAAAGGIGGVLLAHRYRPWYVGLVAGLVAALGSMSVGRAITSTFSTSVPMIGVVIFCVMGFIPGMTILVMGSPKQS